MFVLPFFLVIKAYYFRRFDIVKAKVCDKAPYWSKFVLKKNKNGAKVKNRAASSFKSLSLWGFFYIDSTPLREIKPELASS